MTTYQIVTTTRAGIEYGPEFAVEDAVANLIDNNLDYFIDKLLEEKGLRDPADETDKSA